MPSLTLCYGTKGMVFTKVDSLSDPWIQTLERDSASAIWDTRHNYGAWQLKRACPIPKPKERTFSANFHVSRESTSPRLRQD